MLSIPHLIIIFVVVLVVFGPEKLPELARNLGRVMAEFRKATGDLRMNFEDHLRDLERETEQRRIGGAAPPPTPLRGTIAGDAPSHEASNPSLAASVVPPPPEEIKPETETVSDGGTRPA
jgi:sec-independent protein translocase protein TatB